MKIPLSTFRGADLTRAHSFVIMGAMVVEKIELLDVWEAYQSHIPYALEWFNNDSPSPSDPPSQEVGVLAPTGVFTSPIYEVNLGRNVGLEPPRKYFDSFPLMTPYRHDCIDLRGKIIQISYSYVLNQPNESFTVYLQYMPFSCDNLYTVDVPARIVFPTGQNQHVNIPASVFRGSNLANSHKVFLSGPLTVHRITVLDDIAVPNQVRMHERNEIEDMKLMDDFTLELRTTSTQEHRWRTYKLDMQDQENERPDWTSVEVTSYNMDSKAFQITYSSVNTEMVRLTLLRWKIRHPRKRQRARISSSTSDVNTEAVFYAGVQKKVRIPIVVFKDVNSAFDSALFDGLTIHGFATIHSVELVNTEPAPLPPFNSLLNVVGETVIGVPTLVKDFGSVPSSDIDKMYASGQLSKKARYHLGQIELLKCTHHLSVPVDFSEHPFDPIAGAFRITYSTSISATRSLYSHPAYTKSDDKVWADIFFASGSYKQIIIPFTSWRGSQPYPLSVPFPLLRIHGPLSIHRIELVTTVQNGKSDSTFSGAKKPTVVVTRDNLFMDAYHHISAIYPERFMNDQFRVQFYGEIGSDNDGLSREFFTLVSREIASKSNGLFTSSPESNYLLQIDPDSGAHDNCTSVFNFVGRIMGLAFMHSRVLDIDFAPSIFKLIFNEKIEFSDLKQLDPEIYRSFENMQQDESLDAAELTMTAEYPLKTGMVSVEFEESGADVPITTHNLHIYRQRYTEWRLHSLVEKQINAIRQGIKDTVLTRYISAMRWKGFSRYISGTSVIDVIDWEKHTELDGYSKHSVTVKLFWKCVSKWTNAERGRLLQFVTGSTRLPAAGFSGLDRLFMIYNARDVSRLPVSHTCSNRLDLPPYKTQRKLQAKLRYAMEETRFEII